MGESLEDKYAWQITAIEERKERMRLSAENTRVIYEYDDPISVDLPKIQAGWAFDMIARDGLLHYRRMNGMVCEAEEYMQPIQQSQEEMEVAPHLECDCWQDKKDPYHKTTCKYYYCDEHGTRHRVKKKRKASELDIDSDSCDELEHDCPCYQNNDHHRKGCHWRTVADYSSVSSEDEMQEYYESML